MLKLVNLFQFQNEFEVDPEDNAKYDKEEPKKEAVKRAESRSPTPDRKKKSRRRDDSESPHRKRKSEKSRKRSSSRDRDRNRRRSRSRDDRSRRSRSRDERARKSRSRSRDKFKKHREELALEPEVGKIYDGVVKNISAFGCFVELKGLKKRWEGLVHISQLRREGRVNVVSEVVSRHQAVKVKATAFTGTKLSLSMKDVDQETGEDLNPQATKRLFNPNGDESAAARNPDRPDNYMEAPVVDKDSNDKKKVKQISDFEKWELQQLIAAKAIKLSDLPTFDEETGVLQKDDDSDEDIEIEMVDDECVFLKGHGRQSLLDLSPVKIVKNPDGSLQQAAMMQGALAKERREIKMQQQEAAMNENADDTGEGDPIRPDDPFAYKPDSANTSSGKTYQLAEWKKSLLTGSKGSYGKKTTLSIMEQREGLPIYKLKDELIKAVNDNQILVVIGETGSGKVSLKFKIFSIKTLKKFR